MNPNSGQRMNRPLFRPTLMPMGSMQQVVMSTGGGVFTSSAMSQPTTLPATSLQSLPSATQSVVMQPMRPQRSIPKANLYLCKTSQNASDPPIEGELENSNKVSLNNLEGSFKDLDSQQVKDTLSSFLPHIPGEFDRMPDTMLRQLLEQRTIGGKEFSPLSGQALLGFRLLPGPLPEMYRMDPPSVEAKPHHKKRKHKHKNLDKGGDGGELASGMPSSKFKVPPDAYSFIKQDMSSISPHIAHAPPHTLSHSHSSYMSGGDTSVGGMIKQHLPAKDILAAAACAPMVTNPMSASAQLIPGPGGNIVDSRVSTFPGKKPKKVKKEKRKREKGEKREKKKKKHHSQDPPGPAPSLLPHTPNIFNQFSNSQ
ncbi:uncharacterized protein LOC135339729 [Halichondria panicea]|uniref:uncharacterized protein LOC135339729 n=1 Tax=Halichondria panicea TaxID=6063 RepID=UPI00312B4C4C